MPAPPSAPAPARRLGRRRGLPSGRAVVGGFLVAAAALGVFTAYAAVTAGPDTQWVVAARELRTGETIGPADLALLPIDLPPEVAARAFSDPAAVLGTVIVAPVGAAELLQRSAIAASAPEGLEQLSFAIDADRALAGAIEPGERVDVLASFGSGSEAFTQVLVRGALVLDERDVAGTLAGGSSRRVFTLGLSDHREALAVTHALNAGTVSLVRTTGRDEDPGPDRFSAGDDVHQPGAGQPDAPQPTESGPTQSAPTSQPDGDARAGEGG